MPALGLPSGNFGYGHRSSPYTNNVVLLDFEQRPIDLLTLNTNNAVYSTGTPTTLTGFFTDASQGYNALTYEFLPNQPITVNTSLGSFQATATVWSADPNVNNPSFSISIAEDYPAFYLADVYSIVASAHPRDLTSPRKLTTYFSNATINTSVFKHGSQALSLNGGQDRLEVRTSISQYSTFTLEAWCYYTGFTQYSPIIAIGTDEHNQLSFSTFGTNFRLTIVQGGAVVFDQISPRSNIPLFQWHHYALLCDSYGMRLCFDGYTQQSYEGLTFPFDVTTLCVGNNINGAGLGGINGYIDDVRFSKTVTYTDPFYPPDISISGVVDLDFILRTVSGSINSSNSSTILVYGFNFDLLSSYNFTLLDANTGAPYATAATLQTVDNAQQMSVVVNTTAVPLLVGTPLTLQVESVRTGSVKTIPNAFVVNNGPTWTTPSGTLAVLLNSSRVLPTTTLTATIPDSSVLTYRIISGSLPDGISLNQTTGVLSGTATPVATTTSFAFTVRVTANNDVSRIADSTFGIVVTAPVPSWITPAGTLVDYQDANRIITFTVQATGTGTVTYTLASGALPPNTTLNATTGTISGSTSPVATDTTYSFVIRATINGDSYRTADRLFTMKVYAPIIAFSTTASLGSTFDLQPKTLSIAAAATSGAVTYSVQSGTLPSGCSLNTSTGSLGTTSTVSSTTDYSFTIRATTSSANVYIDRTFTYRLTFTTDGSTSARAGVSAVLIKQITGTTTDGLYYIRPNNAGPVQQIYCDMNTDGGGWMMMARSHPTTGPSSGWGWTGDTIGTVTDFTSAYQAGWYTKFHNYGGTFSEWIFGNRANVNNNTWGPFVYKRFNFDYNTFITADTQQSADYATLKSNVTVYGTTAPPGMQGAIGFPTTGTANNIYYMRDCCGFASYGATPTAMVTTYCNNDSVVYYSGPWCGGSSSDGGGNFLNGTVTTPGNNIYGGTNQYMIMVR